MLCGSFLPVQLLKAQEEIAAKDAELQRVQQEAASTKLTQVISMHPDSLYSGGINCGDRTQPAWVDSKGKGCNASCDRAVHNTASRAGQIQASLVKPGLHGPSKGC
jgi:hypothetical protein